MNVNFNTIGTESDFEKTRKSTDAGINVTASYTKDTRNAGAALVDLNGSLFNNQAYSESGRTKNDIMTQAQNTDAALRHNYMSVMANNMSAEDFARAAEDGFDLSDMDPKETVTILDKIKATLAMSGKEIIGYTDDLSSAQLSKITGSTAFANEIISAFHENDIPITEENVNDVMAAAGNMKDIMELSDGAVKYMTLSGLMPTMENIYMAEHATNGQNRSGGRMIALETSGYYAQKADRLEWSQVEDQAKRIISEAGFDPEDEETLDQAKWMIEESIPLTGENLKMTKDLRSLTFPMSREDIVKSAAMAIANKNAAASGLASGQQNNTKKAIEIAEKVNNIDDSAIDKVIARNEKINIENLYSASETEEGAESRPTDLNLEGKNRPILSDDNSKDNKNIPVATEQAKNNAESFEGLNIELSPEQKREALTARKQLEEIRLSMTVTANLRLIDKGVQLETEPISRVIDALNAEIKEISSELFGTEDPARYRLFEETTAKVSEISAMPLALVGRPAVMAERSLSDIYDEGLRLKMRYEKACATYEAVGTEVRADLGDNIKKAFRNVDELLERTGLEITEENRRAVRILGYNRMEISEENIERVRTMDEKLTGVVNKLKPGAVLGMIKEGHNPLKMTLDDLSGELSRQDRDPSKQEEKYSKFLYKLEKNDEITPEERESYIGIYRLFHTLKMTENAAIGAVLDTGAEMTIENLLSATRTAKIEKRGLDYKVDDSFGGIDTKEPSVRTISSQIESAFIYYSEKADIVYDNLEPEKLHNAGAKEEMLLDELADKLAMEEATEESIKADTDYYSEQAKEVRKAAHTQVSEQIVKELAEFEVETNVETVEAYLNLKSGRRGRNNSVFSQAEKIARLAFKETKQEMLEDLINEDDYGSAYEEKMLELSAKLDDVLANEADTYIDVKTIHLMKKQLTVASAMARQKSFEIPVDVDGRTVSMHVTLRESRADGRKVEAELETADFGHISMAMTVDDGVVKGAFASAYPRSQDMEEYLTEVRDRFINGLRENEPTLETESTNIGLFYRRQEAGSAVAGTENGIFDNRTLLRMAEIFVHAV